MGLTIIPLRLIFNPRPKCAEGGVPCAGSCIQKVDDAHQKMGKGVLCSLARIQPTPRPSLPQDAAWPG